MDQIGRVRPLDRSVIRMISICGGYLVRTLDVPFDVMPCGQRNHPKKCQNGR